MPGMEVIRRLDELGRIVIPVDIRHRLDISYGDEMEIFYEQGSIAMRKHRAGCVFCGEANNLRVFKGKQVCNACRDEILNIYIHINR